MLVEPVPAAHANRARMNRARHPLVTGMNAPLPRGVPVQEATMDADNTDEGRDAWHGFDGPSGFDERDAHRAEELGLSPRGLRPRPRPFRPRGLTRRERRERRRVQRDLRESWNLRFETLGTRIPAVLVAKSPTLIRAAAEEVCWRLAMDAWRAARPHRWRRRAYAAWAAQKAELERRREQLRRLVEAELLTC